MLSLSLSLFQHLSVVSSPPPRVGAWSEPHENTWCNNGALVQDLSKGVSLSACQRACVEHSNCSYVSADQTDGGCMLYRTCGPTDIMCNPAGNNTRGGWFTTYQYGRKGGKPLTKCRFKPHPTLPGAMTAVVVRPPSSCESRPEQPGCSAKCLDGTPPGKLEFVF